MSSYAILRRLKAFKEGRPLPRGERLHYPIAADADILAVAFVRMGGESGPWGVAWGAPHTEPHVLTVGEPRNRTLVAEMMATFTRPLLEHLFHPEFSELRVTAPDTPRPFRQIWLPNATHLEMLHLIAYAYHRTTFGTAERARLLQQLGRACGWLFRESQRAGQTAVVVATEALRESFTFPSEDTRQGHLGYLLAWMRTPGDRDARMAAAAEAERSSIATSLDPSFERDVLEPLVEAFNVARSSGKETDVERSARDIHAALEPELRRRFALTVEAIDELRADGRAPSLGLQELVRATQDEHWYQYLRLEYDIDDADDGPAFTPSPETDRYPAAASSRFYVHEGSEALRESVLLHDDEEFQQEVLAAGDAIRGHIVDVRDEGPGRRTVPVWTIETAGELPLRLREGAELCVVGLPRRTCRVRLFEASGAGNTRFELVVTGCKTARGRDLPAGTLAAVDPALVGQLVTLVRTSGDGISRAKSRKVWAKDLPGSWLTHARAEEPRAAVAPEVAEDLESIVAKLGRE